MGLASDLNKNLQFHLEAPEGISDISTNTLSVASQGTVSISDGFDLSSGYINTGIEPVLKLLGDATFCMWVKPANYSSRQFLLSLSASGETLNTNIAYSFNLQDTSGEIEYLHEYGNGSNISVIWNYIPSTVKWTYLQFNRKADTITLYADGINQGTKVLSNLPTGSADTYLNIGTLFNRTDTIYKYTGSIDSVRIYDRVLTWHELELLNHRRYATNPSTIVVEYNDTWDTGEVLDVGTWDREDIELHVQNIDITPNIGEAYIVSNTEYGVTQVNPTVETVNLLDCTVSRSTSATTSQHPVKTTFSLEQRYADYEGAKVDTVSCPINYTRVGNVIKYTEQVNTQNTLTFNIVGDRRGTRSESVNLNGFVNQANVEDTFIALLTNSLAYATTQNNLVLTDDKEIFTTQDHTNATYVRNPNRVAPTVNLTSISPWNSDASSRKAGIAITRRNIIMSNHYKIATNSTVRFVEADGTVHDRTLIHRQQIASDLAIGRLDSDLPVSIDIANIAPSNLSSYFSEYGLKESLVFYTDQEEKLLLGKFDAISESGNGSINIGRSDNYSDFWEEAVGGDSGSPIFIVINGQVVALATMWNTAEAGVAIHTNITAIQAYCSVTGHSPAIIDLGSYPSD